ncbi:MAG: GNAT family N-acetyltransferase [Bacteroidales bacterium]|nr:GNAT family N-acetyltransferase [Bacteroidales bacterium]
MNDLIVKKTIELTDGEIVRINQLFNSVFGHVRTVEVFKNQYLNTPLGYSYHVMMYEGDELIGFHSGMPFYYENKGQRFIAGLGIDTMTAEGHRDFFNVRDMFAACEKAMKAEGCVLRIGFPNDKSYPVLKKGFKYKDIGKLDTYFLPIRIGGIKHYFRLLNPLSKFFSWCVIQLSRFSSDREVCVYQYQKESESFDSIRYKWYGGDYRIVTIEGVTAHYRVLNHEGVQTAFIVDVEPRCKALFDAVVREVYTREHKSIDLVMYVGHLSFKPMSLLKMPHKFEPKHFNFTCKPLDNESFDDSLYDINKWNVNLSNYDLV